jgi:L-cysteine desulfidase
VLITDYLQQEYKPALGCTEPASIAFATASAAARIEGPPVRIELICDGRMYKNCYAVGIPNSGRNTGILWAVALGAVGSDPEAGLTIFASLDQAAIERAGALIEDGRIQVEVEPERENLYVEVRVYGQTSSARAIVINDHENLVRVEAGPVFEPFCEAPYETPGRSVRSTLTEMPFDELIEMSASLTEADRERLRQGMHMNLTIARHGLSLFPDRIARLAQEDHPVPISLMVCAGVYARMCGEDYPVITLAGSGNKGITCTVPMALLGEDRDVPQNKIEESLALACLLTSATTHRLGTLSAVCGVSNAAGIGLAAGLVLMEGGGPEQISMAINNMVGNVTGMICDGAKIGCAMKSMTAVDAAFRAVNLAMSGIGIPVSDGIVGADGAASLANLGRIATHGMASTDAEILAIMQDKLRKH